jgi:hypothetical protein
MKAGADSSATAAARFGLKATAAKSGGRYHVLKGNQTMTTKNQPGRFDALPKIGPDEPFFVLRAQDNLAADLVELWALRAQASGKCPHDKILEAKNVVQEMREWHTRKNPD